MARNTAVAADASAPPITRILAEFVAKHPSAAFPAHVEREAHRTFMNWLGCAIGAARHPTLEAALAAVQELAPSQQATILGRSERVDIASAALLNGISSHTFDFDDTHLATIIHPAGPVASAALALGEHIGASGREVIDALAATEHGRLRRGLELEHRGEGRLDRGMARRPDRAAEPVGERAVRLALDLGRESRRGVPGDELGEDARDRRRGRVGRDCGVAGHRRAPSR